MAKIIETIGILVLTAVIALVANMVGYGINVYDSMIGVGVVLSVAIVGYILSQLPGLNRVYLIVWVSLLAILVSSPLFELSDYPINKWISNAASKVQFMAIATPLLAYAGLSIGKDIESFKKISWRIVPVALAVCAGTFIFAAIIAQVALKWEGVI